MVFDFPVYLYIMIGITLGLVLFILSIPLKVTVHAVNIAVQVPKSLLSRLGIGNATEDKGTSEGVVNKVGRVAVKTLVMSLRFVILVLRLTAFICVNIGLILLLLGVFIAFISIGSFGLLLHTFLTGDKKPNGIKDNRYTPVQQSVSNSVPSNGTVTPLTPSNGTPAKSIEELAKAYLSNGVNTYLGGNPRKLYRLKGLEWLDAWDDCSGFAVTYVSYIAGKNIPLCRSYNFADNTAGLEKYGWEYHNITDISGLSDLQAGDIICYGGHVEVYISPTSSWGWGYVHKKYPATVNYKEERDSSGKLVSIYNTYNVGSGVIRQTYTAFYRYKGK